MDTNKPFIGYRSPRRAERNNDREGAKNAPLAVLRGWAAGTAGLPGDIEGLIRMLPGIERKEPVLPTSDFYKEWLPLRGDSPTERAFTELGSLTGGAGVGTAARAAKTGVSAGARGALSAIEAAARNAAVPRTLHPQAGVIKMKGGNWLTGSVEDALNPLKMTTLNEVGFANLAERAGKEVADQARLIHEPRAAINNWIDKKLARYVKNEMATPEDPVRALAERGVLHYEPQPHGGIVARAMEHRAEAGFPTGGYSENDLARNYEALTDAVLSSRPASDLLSIKLASTGENPYVRNNPWLTKLSPETSVSSVEKGYDLTRNLGFDHLVDELRNATNPQSGLPRELLWKYSDLDKVTVPQAVQRVSDINKWRAAQKAEADLLRANNAATALYKEYPEAGYRWVELRPQSDLNSLYRESTMDEYNKGMEALKDALKYEGDVMGHCVGGYCDDVASGRSRIFSLRDKKGQPHTTIEVAPGRREGERAVDYRQLLPENYAAKYGDDSDLLERIVQIKGKQNRAPNPEYLPYVQDFVRSGKWSDVGDFQNAGLVDLRNMRDVPEHLKSGPRFLTQSEYDDAVRRFIDENGNAPGYARGGLVTYNPAEIDELASRLMGELEAEEV